MSRTLKTLQSRLSQYVHTFGSFILDIFFPLACLGCKQGDTLLCQSCCSTIKPRYEQFCPYCHRHITPHGETCFACSPQKALDGVFVSYDYEEPLVKTTLHAFKYQSLESLAHPLSELFIRAVSSSGLPIPDCVIPVPLHPWKLRYRGFNQSELLGNALSATLLPGTKIPFYAKNLVRHRFTFPQQKMSNIASRKSNIKDAFSVPKTTRIFIKEKTVWLIDDIATTASTLDACARALKQAGARKVFGVVFSQSSLISQKSLSSRKTPTQKTS